MKREYTISGFIYEVKMNNYGNVTITNLEDTNIKYEFSLQKRKEDGGFLVRGEDICTVNYTIKPEAVTRLSVQQTVYEKITDRVEVLKVYITEACRKKDGVSVAYQKDGQDILSFDYLVLQDVKTIFVTECYTEANLVRYAVRQLEATHLLDIKL